MIRRFLLGAALGVALAAGAVALGAGVAEALPFGEGHDSSLVSVAPVVQSDVCGVGVGVVGIGSAADCHGAQAVTTSGPASGEDEGPSLVSVAPVVQSDVCGVGVGVLGIGALANCGAEQSSSSGGPGGDDGSSGSTVMPETPPTSQAEDPSGSGTPGTPGTPAVLLVGSEDATRVVAPVLDGTPRLLAFTGSDSQLLVGLGLLLIALGACCRTFRVRSTT